jgi:hypothetical protein
LALTSPTGGGRSIGIVRSRTKATEFLSGFPVLDHWAAEFIYFKFQNISKWKNAAS